MLRSTAASTGQQARKRSEQWKAKSETPIPAKGSEILPTNPNARTSWNLRLFEE